MTDYFEAACEIRRQVARSRFNKRVELLVCWLGLIIITAIVISNLVSR